MWVGIGATYSFRQCLGTVVNPSNEPPLLGLVHSRDTRAPEVLDEFSQRYPACRIHVEVVFVLDVFLIYLVRSHSFGTEPVGFLLV
jgi:hypothetical protein